MYYVYLLQSIGNKTTYIGVTSDLRKRFAEHNSGKTKSNKHLAPFKLIYYEAYINKKDAWCRERELKNNSYQKEQLFKKAANSLAPSSNG